MGVVPVPLQQQQQQQHTHSLSLFNARVRRLATLRRERRRSYPHWCSALGRATNRYETPPTYEATTSP